MQTSYDQVVFVAAVEVVVDVVEVVVA